MPAPAGIGVAAGGQVHTWHLLNVQDGSLGATGTHPWDLAHAALQHGLGAADAVVAAEPDLEQSWHWQEQRLPGDSFAARSTTDCTPEGQKGGKYDEGNGFGWHLADTASGLRAARETVGGAAGNITIVHLDTGYDPDHMALPTGAGPRSPAELHRRRGQQRRLPTTPPGEACCKIVATAPVPSASWPAATRTA